MMAHIQLGNLLARFEHPVQKRSKGKLGVSDAQLLHVHQLFNVGAKHVSRKPVNVVTDECGDGSRSDKQREVSLPLAWSEAPVFTKADGKNSISSGKNVINILVNMYTS